MKSYLFLIAIVAITITLASTQKPAPLWPEHFTIAYHFTGDSGKLNTLAKIWYDYNNQLFRTEYENGFDS